MKLCHAGPAVSPSNSPIIHRKRHGIPVAAPPKEHSSHAPPANHRHHKGTHLLRTQMKCAHLTKLMFDAGFFRPAPYKTNNTSATGHGNSGLHHGPTPAPAPAPACVRLPPSKGKRQRNSARAPCHSHQYHSPSYSPGYHLLIILPHLFNAPQALHPCPLGTSTTFLCRAY